MLPCPKTSEGLGWSSRKLHDRRRQGYDLQIAKVPQEKWQPKTLKMHRRVDALISRSRVILRVIRTTPNRGLRAMKEKEPLDPKAAQGLRRELKAALTDFATGKGGPFQLLNQIERVVKYVCNKPKITLGSKEAICCMRKFIEKHACEGETGLPGVDWPRLYCYVKDHRNDIAHTGTAAVRAGTHAAALMIVLLDALLDAGREEEQVMRISEIMVANPTCAEKWQTLADIRRTMLVNDFSVLPLPDSEGGDKWQVVRAEELAAYLLVEDKECREKRKKEILGCVINEKKEVQGLKLYCVKIADEDEPVKKLIGDGRVPSIIVVTNKDKHLVGIVTAFDYL